MLSSNSLSAYRPIFCCKNYNFQYGAILLTKAVLYWKKTWSWQSIRHRRGLDLPDPSACRSSLKNPSDQERVLVWNSSSYLVRSFGMTHMVLISERYELQTEVLNQVFLPGTFQNTYKIPPKSPINSKKNIYIFIRIFWLFSTILTYKFQGEKKDWKTILDLFLIFYLCINPHNPWGEGAVRPPPSLNS